MIISVVGAGSCDERIYELAREVGGHVARRGAVLVTGGLGGVMEAASRGARENNGVTVGILPGFSKDEANMYVDIPITTGLSHARNIIIARTADAVIAVAGKYGTLSEIAIALKLGKPVVGLETWTRLGEVLEVDTPEEAVQKALQYGGA